MSGPKRGIGNQVRVLIEFDMKIKNGETQDDDFQLIDGAIICSEFVLPDRVFTQRIEGDCGAWTLVEPFSTKQWRPQYKLAYHKCMTMA